MRIRNNCDHLKECAICLIALAIVCGLSLKSSRAFADENTSSVDQINIVVSQSCSVEGIIASGGNHTASMVNSQYLGEIGTTTFKTYCNDNNGYTIYAVGYSNDEYGNTLMKHNSDDTRDFNTGTATSGNVSDWAMKLTTIAGTYAPTIHSDTNGAYTSYHVVPSTYTKVVSFDSNTDLPATGVNAVGSGFTSTYAVWVSATQVAGTYTGKVKYTLVHPMTNTPAVPQPAVAGNIVYHPNGSNVVGTMGNQAVSDSSEVTLLASNYSRDGYGFAGWNTKFDYSGTFYGPQEDIVTPSDISTNGLSLYAVWVESKGLFQNSTLVSNLCGNQSGSLLTAPIDGTANLSSVSALTDQRDGQTYAIAKLADGKCWMIENLRVEADNTRGDLNEALSQGYADSDSFGDFIGLPDAETNHFSTTAYANSIYYSGTQSGTATINIGTDNYPAFRIPRYNHSNTNSRASNPTSNSLSLYSYGNYYTWSAAAADTSSRTTNNQLINTTSICPAGWHVPTGGSVTSSINKTGSPNTFREYYSLGYAVMGITANQDTANSGKSYYDATTNTNGDTADKAFRRFPIDMVKSGYVQDSSITNRGQSGTYWSSASNNYSRSYALSLDTTSILYPGTTGIGKRFGRSIRCIADAISGN